MADYTEVFGWPKEWYGENGQFYAQRKLLCRWADRKAVLLEHAGNGGAAYPYEVTPGGGDLMPGAQGSARAYSAKIEPFRSRMDTALTVAKFACYEWALVTVEYSTTAAVKLSDKWVTEELTPTARLINVDIDGKTFESSGDKVLASDNILKWETSFDYVVTYHHLLDVPVAAYTQVNKCNSDVVGSLLLGLTFDTETLLHTRPVVQRSFDPGLINTFTLRYRFPFSPNGWNKFYDYTNAEYSRISGDDPYETFAFSSLVP